MGGGDKAALSGHHRSAKAQESLGVISSLMELPFKHAFKHLFPGQCSS